MINYRQLKITARGMTKKIMREIHYRKRVEVKAEYYGVLRLMPQGDLPEATIPLCTTSNCHSCE